MFLQSRSRYMAQPVMSAQMNTDLFMLISICTVYMFPVQVACSRSCRWNQLTILRPKGAVCFPCPECPEGQGMVPQCGSRITADVTVECVKCKLGKSYSDKQDISSCKPCTICDPNEETISPCTATKNAVCGECNAGFYRATTGDCKPCMRCCADSKDEDIEKQCKAQTNLPANQICRYDVDTIKCAPTAYRTTAPAVLVSTAPVMSQDMMAARTKEGKSGSTLLFISFASCLAFFVCLLLAVMLAFYYKKKKLSSLWCSGHIGRVITTPTQADCNQPLTTKVVFGNEKACV
ncbi:unnamed protein product [Pocillopora meandrina]|uniref:TNFR-Cys domain-containing protein n=1 Tax=Pocillopora meandrina TaxID=46732 RepID=A0AAU9VP56_9CNID|nr:unnamed protein product [Pocillopora meandrina]